MTGELDLCGVFISPLLACGVAALVLQMLARVLLGWAGFYRAVWHASLADFALFIIILSVLSRAFYMPNAAFFPGLIAP